MDALPGTALGLVLPEPEQDQVVAGLLARLWARPHDACPVRPAHPDVRGWADEFEQEYGGRGRRRAD